MARTHVGSCDFSLKSYVYQSKAGDFTMSTFNMSHDHALLIPFIRRAQQTSAQAWQQQHPAAAAAAAFKLVSSPWTPPAWLKGCNELYCPAIGCGLRAESAETPYRSAYALYLSKYLSEMAANGIKPWAITPQNEPQACKPLMESTSFTAAAERDFVRDQLGPQLLKDGHADVKVLAYDHNKDNIVKWADTILGDNSTAQFVAGTAFHWYSSHDYFEHLEAVHAAFPEKILLATEATEGKDNGHYTPDPAWSKGEHYGHVILGDLNHWAQGWIDWNVLLDMRGGPTHPGPAECEGVVACGDDAMIIADTTFANKTAGVDTFYPQAFYWYMGHFSRYVLPGSRRVHVDNPLDKTGNGGDAKGNPDGSLEVFSALLPPPSPSSPSPTESSGTANHVAVVVMNRNNQEMTFTLQDAATKRATPPLTIAAHAIHTYWYNATM